MGISKKDTNVKKSYIKFNKLKNFVKQIIKKYLYIKNAYPSLYFSFIFQQRVFREKKKTNKLF